MRSFFFPKKKRVCIHLEIVFLFVFSGTSALVCSGKKSQRICVVTVAVGFEGLGAPVAGHATGEEAGRAKIRAVRAGRVAKRSLCSTRPHTITQPPRAEKEDEREREGGQSRSETFLRSAQVVFWVALLTRGEKNRAARASAKAPCMRVSCVQMRIYKKKWCSKHAFSGAFFYTKKLRGGGGPGTRWGGLAS